MEMSTAEIKSALVLAIKNCNRNLYEWLEKKKRGSIYTISYTEANGLVKNWIKRSMKDIKGPMHVDRVLKEGNLVVSIDDKTNSIMNLTLSSHREESWRNVSADIALFNSCFQMIDYKALRYDPKDYLLDGTTPSYEGVTHPSLMDLSSIENAKFQ